MKNTFNKFLASITKHPINLTPIHATYVRHYWEQIKTNLNYIKIPQAEIGIDGSLTFVWNTKNYYLEINIYPDGTHAWFFRDRVTGCYDGTEEPERNISLRFYQHAIKKTRGVSMLKVTNSIEVYQINDEDCEDSHIEIRSHQIGNDMVVIVIDGKRYKVVGRDVIAAVHNAMNTAKF